MDRAPKTHRLRSALAMATTALTVLVSAQTHSGAQETSVYQIGELSNAEQYYLELLNRARMYPHIEGGILSHIADSSARLEYDFFGVDLDVMEHEIALYPPQPPLAPNKRLSEMAYDHALDMLLNEFQGHTGSNGESIRERAEAAGYFDWTALGENVFSYAQTPDHSHASFEVDWGNGSFGMQQDRPHRENIHNADFHEVGIARVLGRNGSVGPELVAQEFGNRESAGAFITGVVYFDLNGSRFYEPGEGIGGALVTVRDSGFHAITTASGGYAIPVTDNSSQEVTFNIDGIKPHTETVEIVNGENVKIDFSPEWTPPTVNGPRIVASGVARPFRVSHSPGSIATDVLVCRVEASPAGEGAEAEGAHFRLKVDGSYEAIQNEVVAKGSNAFHLAHESADASHQILTLERTFVPGRNSALHFRSLLALADSGQLAKVQLSANGSEFWSDVWVKEGKPKEPDSGFIDQHIDLSKYAGQWIQIRFNFFIGAGYVLEGTANQFGWFIDDIAVTGVEEITDVHVEELGTDDVFDLVLPGVEKVRLYTRARTQGAKLPPANPINVRSVANDFEGWKLRTNASQRDVPLSRIPGSRPRMTPYQQYALEPNKGILPVATISEDGEKLILDYAIDTARKDVLLVPQLKIDDNDWITSDERFTNRLVRATNGSIEKRSAVFRIQSSRNVQMRLAIIDPSESDEDEEDDDQFTQN